MRDCLNFVTLFDINYVDRGIVMYESLREVTEAFHLYIIAFDRETEKILLDMMGRDVTIISYEDFEDECLRGVKTTRSWREYLWTCSSYAIKYVMSEYDLEVCTYIDADLYFYNSPYMLLEEFIESGCDVAIMPHNYSDHPEYDFAEKKYGKYCVEFNTFRNTDNGRKILDWWIDRCLNKCTDLPDEESFGDQKYLDRLILLFDGVYTYTHDGAGVAPWNVDAYRWDKEGTSIVRCDKNKRCQLLFYHFHSFEILDENKVNWHIFARPGKHDFTFVEDLYIPYSKRIIAIRKQLKQHYKELYYTSEENGDLFFEKINELFCFLTCEPRADFLIRKIIKTIRYRKRNIHCLI